MKAVVAYYSRTGNTAKAAKAISEALGCETKKITDLKDRSGIFGFLSAGKDATSKKPTRIKEGKTKRKSYDLYIVGTPTWGGNPCPAIRTYLSENKKKMKMAAFFCTAGGENTENNLQELEKISGKKPIAVLSLRTEEVQKGAFEEKAKAFVRKIRANSKK